MEVKFRAGKKDETGAKPRPMVVMVEDDETREKLLVNARRLARSERWRKVFVSQDLTWRQREEARKEEANLREKAERMNEEAKNEGKEGGKYVVVGRRGKRWIKWWVERGREG